MKHHKYSKQAQDEREEQSKAIWSVIFGLATACVFILMFMAGAGMIE